MNSVKQLLQERLTADNFDKLIAVNNEKMHTFVADAIKLTNPDSVLVLTDDEEELAAIREMAKNGGGEHA